MRISRAKPREVSINAPPYLFNISNALKLIESSNGYVISITVFYLPSGSRPNKSFVDEQQAKRRGPKPGFKGRTKAEKEASVELIPKRLDE